jgi:hypothetical protein
LPATVRTAVGTVVAVLEVKAAINSKAVLNQALDNIASVKVLDRTNRGRNIMLIDRIATKSKPDRDAHNDQIFGAIVTEKSLASDFSKRFLAWLNTHPRREWPNLYVDVHRFTAHYRYTWSDPGVSRRRVVGPLAMSAEEFAVSRPDINAEPPLVILGFQLVNWFRVASVISMTSEAIRDPLADRSSRRRTRPFSSATTNLRKSALFVRWTPSCL